VKARFTRGVSAISITAALSAAALLVALGWQAGGMAKRPPVEAFAPPHELPRFADYRSTTAAWGVLDANGDGIPDWQEELLRLGFRATTTDFGGEEAGDEALSDLADRIATQLIGGYLTLKEYNAYSPESGQRLADVLAESLRVSADFIPHTADELTLTSDVSLSRVLSYRADMREALPVLITDTEPEFFTFARFLETGDRARLEELRAAAARYRAAEEALLAVTVPADAAQLHLDAANALGAYAVTLEKLIRYSDDPMTTLALLRTYNENERELLSAFSALSAYYVRKATR